MDFLQMIKGTGKKGVRASSMVGITEAGKREAEKYSSKGDQFAILAELNDRSPQRVSNIADETGLTTSEVIAHCKALERDQYVRFTGV